MRIDVVVFDGFDDLDAIAPYEVLRHASAWTQGWDVALVGGRAAGRVTSSHQVRYDIEHALGDVPPDGIVVAGGGWHARGAGARAEVEHGELPRRLADLAGGCRWTASVCTGAMLLSAAGLLRGRPATTHPSALDDLRDAGALVDADRRVVDDGDVLTAGAITSGLDLALRIVERELGPDTAREVAERMAIAPPPALAERTVRSFRK